MMRRTNIGGQAVIEGVMMRGQKIYAMAVQTPEKGLVVEKKDITGGLNKIGLFRLPIFRGMAAFVDSLIVGTQIMMRSAELAGEVTEEEEPSRLEKFLIDKFGEKKIMDVLLYVSVVISLILAVALFMLLPVFVGNLLKPILPGSWALGIVESAARLFIFFGYLFLISRMKEIKRVFQYHGAEHKTINCFESEEELTVENVKKHTRLHKRCGTSFLFLVMAVSIVVLFFVQVDTLWLRLITRILLVPFIAGISYEVLRWAGRSNSVFVKLVSWPGLKLQLLTTAEPDGSQIEAAIAALKGVLEEEPE